MNLLPDTDIYAVTNSSLSLGRSTAMVVEELLKAGVRIIQYREKNKGRGDMLAECREISSLCKAAGACFIVNDHVDIALLCNADGVHVGQKDIPLEDVRALVGPERIVGVSVHNDAEVARAVSMGADYLGVGAIFNTSTKADATYTGLEFAGKLAKNSPIPVVGIGGISASNLRQVAAVGVRYFAMVSALVSAGDIGVAVTDLRKEIAAGRTSGGL